MGIAEPVLLRGLPSPVFELDPDAVADVDTDEGAIAEVLTDIEAITVVLLVRIGLRLLAQCLVQ